MTNTKFKQRLSELGLTYREFAKLSGYAYQTINNIANGQRKVNQRIINLLEKL